MDLKSLLDKFVEEYFYEHDGDIIFNFNVIVEHRQTEINEDRYEIHLSIPDEECLLFQITYLTRDEVIDLIEENGYDVAEIDLPDFHEVLLWNTVISTSHYYEYNKLHTRVTDWEHILMEWHFDVSEEEMLSDVVDEAYCFLKEFDLDFQDTELKYHCTHGYEYILDEVKKRLAQ